MGRIIRAGGYEVNYQKDWWEPSFHGVWQREPNRLQEDGEEWAEAEFADCLRRERLAAVDELDRTGLISFGELEAIPSEASMESLLELQDFEASIRAVVQTLTETEATVIGLRFGFEDGHSYTLYEVGEELAATRERVRQIEAKALRRLRHPSRSRQLYAYTHREPVKPKPAEPELMPYPEEKRLRDRLADLTAVLDL